MASKYDIESLRSEGIQAIANSQNYTTTAIRGNGKSPVTITNPDLTANERQLFDWYDMDAGLNLNTLGADLELFKSAVTTMKSAAERQHGQLQQLMGMWEGQGSEAANQFLRTHNSTADAVTEEFGKVSTGLDGLRDALWNIVDLKKQASTMVDGLVTDRTVFDNAVATYKTGTGDKSQADETNATKIGPHVQGNIEGKWLPAMKTAWAKGSEAYDALINGLKEELPPEFKTPPGQFGPEWSSDGDPQGNPTNDKDKNDKDKNGEDNDGEDNDGNKGGDQEPVDEGKGNGGMQGPDTPASGPSGYSNNGQMPSNGQQSGQQGQQGQGMDPSQIVSGLTSAMTGALGSIGEAASGIVSAITEGLSNIPFDQMGQDGESGSGEDKPEDEVEGKADETADKKDPDAKMAAAKDAAIQEARADAGGTFATDGKPASGVQLAGSGGLEATPVTPGQTTPGAPLGTTLPAQPAGSLAPVTPPPAQPQQPSPVPAVGPTDPPAQPQAAGTDAGETPCEIAADELPKAGR